MGFVGIVLSVLIALEIWHWLTSPRPSVEDRASIEELRFKHLLWEIDQENKKRAETYWQYH